MLPALIALPSLLGLNCCFTPSLRPSSPSSVSFSSFVCVRDVNIIYSQRLKDYLARIRGGVAEQTEWQTLSAMV
ncbi:hypothetical protein L484_009922 [Morus notabilis]|uniref:Secreted protein n=1 Tax=Morus notabilis TaxID=981085 RepID=W9QWW4_9ROSA|nr:hypothetical protein L484_009922 [Morus notabilis]